MHYKCNKWDYFWIKIFNFTISTFSVYINKSRPRTLLLWWKRSWHSATSVFDLSFLWAVRFYRGLSSWSCVFVSESPIGFTRFSRSDLSHMRFYPWRRSKSRSYLVGFFNTYKSRAPINGAKRPHIISRRTFAIWCRSTPSTTFTRRWWQWIR